MDSSGGWDFEKSPYYFSCNATFKLYRFHNMDLGRRWLENHPSKQTTIEVHEIKKGT